MKSLIFNPIKAVSIFKISCVFFALSTISFVQAQEKKQEVFIIGTMHEVPKIVKHSYKPLLKIAKKYTPDAIYVERQRPTDSLSLQNYEKEYFIPLGDSIAQTFVPDQKRYDSLMANSIHKMNKDDYTFLSHHFAINRDKANYIYYRYLLAYGVEGSKQPLRNENYDLTAPLGIAMDINFIYAMDHQHETQRYTKLSRECYKESRKDEQLKRLKKHNKRDYRKHILPGLFGNLGKYSNRIKTVKRYQFSNRFEFRATPCDACDKAAAVWDRRNAGMAKNIGEQVLSNQHQKAIVIVGAGHLIGLKSELEKQYPQLSIKIMDQ